jgi:5-methylcytosine-specific restriction endonuclease McrA
MNNLSYRKYIKSNSWKRLRKQTLIRDNYICKFCGEKATDVHHIQYPEDFKNDSIDNLISCCKKCHEKQDDIIGYDELGVIRNNIIHECNICKIKFNEIELDMVNGVWICSSCESLKFGDKNGKT